MSYSIANVTGTPRANGGTLLQFSGPANRGVVWSIVTGSGALTPFADFTDQYGRAWARYDAGGYYGPLAVQVSYGA